MATPITVFTGFLGSGKTTIILSLLSQLQKVNPNYKVVLLKNEFGDVEVDSKLINNASAGLISVSEIMNGCLCCVLVGQLKTGFKRINNFKKTNCFIYRLGRNQIEIQSR